MIREYPAYGRTIAAHLARGEKPLAIAVVLSNRWWHLLDHVPRVCVRSDDWEAGRYEWSYLRGMHVVAFAGDCNGQPFGELLLDLMDVGPSMLWAFDLTGQALSVHNPADAHALAPWVADLAGLERRDARVERARWRYADAIADAARCEVAENERIAERSGVEAAARWAAERMGWPDLVRERFAGPLRAAAGETLAA